MSFRCAATPRRAASRRSIDGIHLVQEYHRPRGRSIVRVETLEGRYLYGIRVHLGADDDFDLCRPTSAAPRRANRSRAPPARSAAQKSGLAVEAYDRRRRCERPSSASRRRRTSTSAGSSTSRASATASSTLRRQRAVELRRRSVCASSASIRRRGLVDALIARANGGAS